MFKFISYLLNQFKTYLLNVTFQIFSIINKFVLKITNVKLY